MRKTCIILVLIFLLTGGKIFAEPWPVGKSELKFEQAVNLARLKFKEEHGKKGKLLNKYPIEEFIIVRATYGTAEKSFDTIVTKDNPLNVPNAKPSNEYTWGWTFEFAVYWNASVGAIIHVNAKEVILLGITS